MINHYSGSKKGQQLIMPMARNEESPAILKGKKLEVIDIRSDWKTILQTIHDNKIIHRTWIHGSSDWGDLHLLFRHLYCLKK